MLPEVFQILKAAPDVTAIVGTDPVRVYRHDNAPQAVSKPYVTWFVVAGTPENELSDVPGMDHIVVQIDCWSRDDAEVVTLAQAVRDAIEPHVHMTGMPVNGREAETKLFRMSLQFDFWLSR